MIFPFLLPRGGCRTLTSFKIRHITVSFFVKLPVAFQVLDFVTCCVAGFPVDGVLDMFAVRGTPGSVHYDIDLESCNPVRGGSYVRGVPSKVWGIVDRPLFMKPFCSFVRLALR